MVGPLKGGESLADGHFLRASGELGALKRCQDGKRAGADDITFPHTGPPDRMSDRKWRESKQQLI